MYPMPVIILYSGATVYTLLMDLKNQKIVPERIIKKKIKEILDVILLAYDGKILYI